VDRERRGGYQVRTKKGGGNWAKKRGHFLHTKKGGETSRKTPMKVDSLWGRVDRGKKKRRISRK